MRGGRGGFSGVGGFRGGGFQNNRAIVCRACGGMNHYARDCQAAPTATKCYSCGKIVCYRVYDH